MKERIFLCLTALLFSLTVHSQTSEAPDGVAGLKFGMTLSEVKAAWNTRGLLYQDYQTIKSTIGSIVYLNLSVGTETFDIGVAKFIDNKLYEVILSKIPLQDSFAQDVYFGLLSILASKYNNGSLHREFRSPYKEGDGYEMQAVRMGKADIYAVWNFSPISIIKLEIQPWESGLAVAMIYQSVELYTEVDKVIKKVNDIEF